MTAGQVPLYVRCDRCGSSGEAQPRQSTEYGFPPMLPENWSKLGIFGDSGPSASTPFTALYVVCPDCRGAVGLALDRIMESARRAP